MPFLKNGEPHRDGVRNEKNTFTRLKDNPDCVQKLGFGRHYEDDLQFTHQGGTKTVDDIQIKNQKGEVVGGISAKNHKKKSSTCDFMNTSQIENSLPASVVTPNREKLSEIRANHKGDATQVEPVRKDIKKIQSGIWSHFSEEKIRELLKTINERNPSWILIEDVRNKRMLNYMHSQLTELAENPYNDENTYSLGGKAAGSRDILCNGKKTQMKLRFGLNNGVSALLGVGKGSNRNSSWTIKVQWNVEKFINTTQPYGEYSYESSE